MKRSRLSCCALLLAACAHAPGHAPTASVDELGTERIARQVEQLRGLARKRALKVEVLDAAGMKAALLARTKLDERELASERSVWVAFGFVPAGFDLSRSVREVIGEQVLAFYDHKRKTLFLPRPKAAPSPSLPPAEGDNADGVIAHEIEHALQDQRFGLDRKQGSEDRRLAWSALVEGDAMLVMVGLMATRNEMPLSIAFARLGRYLASVSPEALAQMGGHAPALSGAPALLRETLIFPYIGALDLLAGVHRAGSFALVNQLFLRPPASTEQVLHPEKYLTGEQPISVEVPRTPPGFRAVQSESLGELRTRVLLASCLPTRDAEESASGWGGDRYTVGEARDGRLALVWSTVWDDELSAIRFERGLLVLGRCWKATPQPGLRPAISADMVIVREGTRVALVRGIPADQGEPMARALLRSPQRTPAPIPPLAITAFPAAPIEPASARHEPRAQLINGRYVSSFIGIESEVPVGFVASLVGEQPRLVLQRASAPPAIGQLLFMDSPSTQEHHDQFFAGVASAASKTGPLRVIDETDYDLGWAQGRQRSWRADAVDLNMRAIVVPACGGRASIALSYSWRDAGGLAALEAWARAIAPTAGTPPACASAR